MDEITQQIIHFRRLGVRHTLMQLLNFAMVISSTLCMWKGLGVICNSESPIVVVLSGSMEPAFYRGDLLFLALPPKVNLEIGDITVYNSPQQSIPIVHRVVETHDYVDKKDGRERQLILTKGDNNQDSDEVFYGGKRYLEAEKVIGKVYGFVPYVGYVTIAMTDFPMLKYAMIGIMGLWTLIQRE